jgi:hypothetical protein
VRRVIEKEFLDELPPNDPRAIRSRRDLQRINLLMGNVRLLARLLRESFTTPPRLMVELGCGDGTAMLALARRLSWRTPIRVQLLDMAPVVSQTTLEGFHQLGWSAEILQVNLHDWVRSAHPCDLIIANLFLHHFRDDELRRFFKAFSEVTKTFVSCDPRRWRPALFSSHFLWAIGCNRITQHDAIVSIRAGFRDRELSALWPASSPFRLREQPGGYASHLFFAQRPH